MAVKLKTKMPAGRKMKPGTKRELPEKDLPKEVEDVEDVEKVDGEEKSPNIIPPQPELHPVWPSLMVISILSCIGIPFVGTAERFLIGCLALGAVIYSVYKTLEYEKNLSEYYMDYPEMTPANKQKKYDEMRKQRRKKRNSKGKAIKLNR